jgi:hypothetical protein
MSRGIIVLVICCAFSALASLEQPDAAAEKGSNDTTAIHGTYEYVGGQKQIDEMNRRIEEGVEELNVFIRGIAERRLREANRPTDRLTITHANGEIIVARSGRPDMAAPANGTSVDWENPENGNELKVSHEIRNGVLWQRLKGDRGSSVNRFVLSKDGKRLSVNTQVRVDRLEDPIRFDVTYRSVSNVTP